MVDICQQCGVQIGEESEGNLQEHTKLIHDQTILYPRDVHPETDLYNAIPEE